MIDEPISLRAKSPTAPADGDYDGCPTVQLNGPEALEIPEHFTVTFRGHRGQIVARSATRREPASATVTLHLHKLCAVEEAEPELTEDAGEDSNPIDRLFEQASDEAPEKE